MAGSILGAAVKRTEDPRFIRGRGSYVANRAIEGCLWMVPVRSALAHGIINQIDTSMAADMEGVIGVFTAADFELDTIPPSAPGVDKRFSRPLLAEGTVRFAGEILAIVVAETERQAVDAASMVFPDIDALPAVTDPREALRDEVVVHSEIGTNLAKSHEDESDPELFDSAPVTVTVTVHSQRLAAVPLETNNALAIPDPAGGPNGAIEVLLGSQNVFGHRNRISRLVGVDRYALEVKSPDMGGGFGAKFATYPEQALTVALAQRLGAPVRWHEDRRGNLTGMYHGRAAYLTVTLAADETGNITGLRAEMLQDAGAYPTLGAHMPYWTRWMATGVYHIPHVEFHWKALATNTTPIHAYRGAGRPEATQMIERAMDVLAAKLGMDPAELRRRNYLQPNHFPYSTPTGVEYDSGAYETSLDLALQAAGYDELRREQRHRRESGDSKLIGIGLSTYVEVTAVEGPVEWTALEIHTDGTATARVGTSGHGQGHETAFAQVVSALTKIDVERIRVLQADTSVIPRGDGTGGSRSLQLAGSGLYRASEEVVAKARRLVAEHLEAALDDVQLADDARIGVVGVPDSGMTWGEVAALAAESVTDLDDADEVLGAEFTFDQGKSTFPFGTHLSVVEVDIETGAVRLLRHIAVDDCGTVLNPLLVAGQVHGGIAQGAGQALYEAVRYDDDGNSLSGNLTSYLLPTADSLPSVERRISETPTPHNPLGAKGIGEAATIGSTPAIHNAVIDALTHLGVEHIDMPLTPATVWQAING